MTQCPTWKYHLDLHVHTRRFSPCAEALDPAQLYQEMIRQGLHGVVITEHDQLWPAKDIAALNAQLGTGRIYRGVEVSSRNGHFIVIGLDHLDGIRPGIGIHDLIRKVNHLNAALIWAHPFLNYSNVPEPLPMTKMPKGIHAVEAASGVTNGEETVMTLALAHRMGCTAVGGSDAHYPGQVGCAYTRFARLPKNETALAAAIRAGRCRISETIGEMAHNRKAS